MNAMINKNSVHDLLRLVFRRRIVFLLGAALFAMMVLVASHYVALKYTGKAIFEFGLETAAEEISRTSRDSFGTIKERMVHDLSGYQAVEKAIEELGLTEGLAHAKDGSLTVSGQSTLQQMVTDFMEDVEVTWEARSAKEDLVSISFTSSDPLLAEKVPNILVKNYINRTYERILTGLKRQHDFLKEKYEDANRELEKAMRDKIDFETQHAGMLPDNPSAFQEKIERAQAELTAAQRRLEVAQLRVARLDALKSQSTSRTPDEANASKIIKQPNPELARLKRQLNDLQDELDTALVFNRMTEEHPKVKSLRIKITQTENRIKNTPPEIVRETVFASGADVLDISMASAAAKSEHQTATNDIKRLTALLAGYNKMWANFAPVRQDYLALLKKTNDNLAEVEHWKGRLDQVQIALAAAVDNRLTRMKAIQPSHHQFLPAWPSLPAILALAICGGLAFGAALVFLAKSLDRTIKTPEEAAEYFDVPVHGVIGEIVTPARRLRRLIRRWVLVPAMSLVVVLALFISGTSAVLRLTHPQSYKQMWSSPVGFMQGQITPAVDRISEKLRD